MGACALGENGVWRFCMPLIPVILIVKASVKDGSTMSPQTLYFFMYLLNQKIPLLMLTNVISSQLERPTQAVKIMDDIRACLSTDE